MCTKTLEKENSKWKWKWICPTTGEICNGLDIQQRPNCHYIEEYAIILVEAVAKKKKILTSKSILLFFVFRIFMKVKFLVAGWLWPRGLGQLTNPVGVDPSYQQATIQATGCCAWRWRWRWWINKQSKQLQQHVSPSPPFFHPPTLCCSICFVSISISCLVSLCVPAVSVGHLTTMSVNGQMKVFAVGAMKRGAMWCGDCGCHS